MQWAVEGNEDLVLLSSRGEVGWSEDSPEWVKEWVKSYQPAQPVLFGGLGVIVLIVIFYFLIGGK